MKTWFITGSSSGIGRGIANAVLQQGDNAVIMARDGKKIPRSSTVHQLELKLWWLNLDSSVQDFLMIH